MKFRVESIFHSKRPVMLIARQLDPGAFELSMSPRLSGVPIQRALTQPRKLLHDGTPDLSVFVFILTDAREAKKFAVGQIVELEP